MVSEIRHDPAPAEKVKICVPTPAIDGLNIDPAMPTPDHVPEIGVAPVRVTREELRQTEKPLPAFTVVGELTLT